MALTLTCGSHGALCGVLLAAVFLLCLGLRPGATAPVEDACPCSDPSHCELITAPPRKEIFAFVVSHDNWKKYDWSKITTIGLYTKEFDPELMCYAHSKGARIVPAIGYYPPANLSSPVDRKIWIDQQVAQAKSWHTDGINFDIEYVVTPEQAKYVSDLVNETAQAFRSYNPHAQISFDIAGLPFCPFVGCFDNYALAQSCDFLFAMNYDFGSIGPVALPNSPFFLIKYGMDLLRKQGIPADKLVLGLPWYGYDYPCLEVLPGDICIVNRTFNPSNPTKWQEDYKIIDKHLANSSTGRLFSTIAESPYFFYEDASGRTHDVRYDDPSSLAMRYAYAKAENLRGVGMWNADSLDYSDDPIAKEQTKAMWDAIDKFV